jgi:hypothetical protein
VQISTAVIGCSAYVLTCHPNPYAIIIQLAAMTRWIAPALMMTLTIRAGSVGHN